MKLAFTERGWESFSFDRLTGLVKEAGFDGVELYDLFKREDFFLPGAPLNRYMIASTMRSLRDSRIEIPCLDTSVDLTDDLAVSRLTDMIGLAGDMRVPYVSTECIPDREDLVREKLGVLTEKAAASDVILLLKTRGIYADTARLKALLDDFASDSLGVLWDMHHSFHDFNESADTTIKNLGGYVRHVHIRDAAADGSYTIIGEGTLPIREMMDALASIDYDGFISLEWKPQWEKDLQDADFIFPHFVRFMNRFRSDRTERRKLYLNHDGSGEYIWKKDELIDLTFGQMLDRVVSEFPNQYAFRYTTLDYTRTYEEFREDADNFARALVSLGVRSGMKVAIWATNVPAWYITFWACVRIGAVLVTVNTAYKIHEAEYLLRQSDTHTLVMIESALDSNYRAIVNELCPELREKAPEEALHAKRLPFLRNVITVGFRERGALTMEEAMARAPLVPIELIRKMASEVKPNDVCNMQYTSGTTGFPKGVMLTHYNVVNNGKCIGDRMGLSTADRMMIQVPMFHCFGMVLSMTASMTHGTTMCPMPYFSAKTSLACIDQEKITCFNGVPTMFIAMFNHENYRKTDFSHMRTGIMAGSGCPPELMKRAADPNEMNMRGIVSVYGQTESSPGSTMSAWTDSLEVRTETVGYAFPNVQCKVIDPETGEEVGPGVNGEFCSRGYNTMKGYYKMPDATRETVDAEGWLHSGDIACRDEAGNYKITGRLKDMIIRGGENIYPKEIEEFIYTHPAVQDVQVIAVPDKRYGEEAMAMIILKEGMTVTEPEMREFIVKSLARHKVPKYIEFTDSFPMNAAGKILKYKMREDAVKRLGL